MRGSYFSPTLIRQKFADEFFVRILFNSRFLRAEPLGEGVAEDPAKRGCRQGEASPFFENSLPFLTKKDYIWY